MGFMKRQAMREEQGSKASGHLPGGGMHPPTFRPQQRLMDWPDCSLEMRCPACNTITLYPTKLLASRHGNRTFADVLGRMKCKRCAVAPAAVYLCAGHRTRNGGPDPDWAVELRAPSKG